MPKIKTHRGAAKRFKVTARGKIARRRAGKSHLLFHKSRRRKRALKTWGQVDSANLKAMRRVLPYNF